MIKILKKVFNLCFDEKRKERMRIKFMPLFVFQDKLLYKRTYKKMFNYILKQSVDKAKEYAYREDKFLEQTKNEYIKYLILNDEETNNNLQYKDCLDFIRKNGINTFCYNFIDYKVYDEHDVFFDEESKLYWVYYRDKKLYLKRSINTVQSVLEVMNMLAAEQEPTSPHCYVDDTFKVSEGDIVFDIGCAEGNFALSIVDSAEKVYMFEADDEWIEALNCTFKPYKEKISIIPKFVSDKNASNSISIDTFCDKNQIDRIHFIKMDVEGAEPDVLRGAKKLIKEGRIEKIAACTYHNAEDEKKIRQILCDFDCQTTSGFMQVAGRNEIWNIKKPFFLPTLVRCRYQAESINGKD